MATSAIQCLELQKTVETESYLLVYCGDKHAAKAGDLHGSYAPLRVPYMILSNTLNFTSLDL